MRSISDDCDERKLGTASFSEPANGAWRSERYFVK